MVDNLINQNFITDAPNKVWVTDITYIPTREAWLYLATHKDIFNGEIVGYAMDSHMRESLVKNSLLMAIHKRKPGAGLIHHSDRGSQYCAYEYQKLISGLLLPSVRNHLTIDGKYMCHAFQQNYP